MFIEGHVENGQIVLDEPQPLAEGARVRIEVLNSQVPEPSKSLYEVLKPIIGTVNDLPPDAATNLDHYLYGAPKQKP